MRRTVLSIRSLSLGALFAALMCLIGPVSIPIGAVPVSLMSFVVALAACLLGWQLALLSCFCYLILGAAGLPVFSGFLGGLGRLVGPTGGFLIGYLALTLIAGLFAERSGGRIFPTALGLCLGMLCCYAFGCGWFLLQMHCSFGYALTVCVLPFLLFDALKLALALWISRLLRRRLPR